MKEWYYIASDKPEEKNYFARYDDTQFAILCIFRFKAPIKLYPERFMTADRILKAKACPDKQ